MQSNSNQHPRPSLSHPTWRPILSRGLKFKLAKSEHSNEAAKFEPWDKSYFHEYKYNSSRMGSQWAVQRSGFLGAERSRKAPAFATLQVVRVADMRAGRPMQDASTQVRPVARTRTASSPLTTVSQSSSSNAGFIYLVGSKGYT